MTMMTVKILAYILAFATICGGICVIGACLGILSAAELQRRNEPEFDDSGIEEEEH